MNFAVRHVRSLPGLSLISFVVLLTIAASSWAGSGDGRNKPEKIVAAFHCDYSPVYFWDKTTDRPSGFFVDIMDSIAARAGLQVSYICRSGWPEIISAIENKEADLGVLMKSGER